MKWTRALEKGFTPSFSDLLQRSRAVSAVFSVSAFPHSNTAVLLAIILVMRRDKSLRTHGRSALTTIMALLSRKR